MMEWTETLGECFSVRGDLEGKESGGTVIRGGPHSVGNANDSRLLQLLQDCLNPAQISMIRAEILASDSSNTGDPRDEALAWYGIWSGLHRAINTTQYSGQL